MPSDGQNYSLQWQAVGCDAGPRDGWAGRVVRVKRLVGRGFWRRGGCGGLAEDRHKLGDLAFDVL